MALSHNSNSQEDPAFLENQEFKANLDYNSLTCFKQTKKQTNKQEPTEETHTTLCVSLVKGKRWVGLVSRSPFYVASVSISG